MKNKIRVLHVLTALDRGGIETLLMNYYRKIDRNKLQFDFLIHREGKFAYSDEIEKLGGKIYHVPAYNPFSKSYHKALNQFFKTHSEYKIIHCHMNCLSAIPLYYAKRNNISIRIAHSHIIINQKNFKSLYKRFMRHFIKFYANYYFACSDEAGKWMFGKKRNFFLMKNAIDSRIFVFDENKSTQFRKMMNIDKECIVLGHVGRFTEQKNQIFLLNLIEQIDEKYMLVCIGTGEDKNRLQSIVKEKHISERVKFLDSVPNVNEYMQIFDVFVFPSLYEGLGIVAVEAQAAGIPVICSKFVPREVKVNENCVFLPLKYDYWYKEIKRMSALKKVNRQKEIIDCHYDIYEAKSKLEDIYIKLYNSIS